MSAPSKSLNIRKIGIETDTETSTHVSMTVTRTHISTLCVSHTRVSVYYMLFRK